MSAVFEYSSLGLNFVASPTHVALAVPPLGINEILHTHTHTHTHTGFVIQHVSMDQAEPPSHRVAPRESAAWVCRLKTGLRRLQDS